MQVWILEAEQQRTLVGCSRFARLATAQYWYQEQTQRDVIYDAFCVQVTMWFMTFLPRRWCVSNCNLLSSAAATTAVGGPRNIDFQNLGFVLYGIRP